MSRSSRVLLASALAALATSVSLPAFAGKYDVRIVNKTDFVITEFYASRSSTNDWEEDMLDSDVMGSGEALTVRLDDGSQACKFDFRAVFDDGDVVERHNINICEIEQFYFTQQ